MVDDDPRRWSRADWEREERALERELAEALGRLVIRFEVMSLSLRELLSNLCSVGIHDLRSAIYDVEPKTFAILGHTPYKSLVWSLQALWDEARIGVPVERSFIKELLELEEERNGMVHSVWWSDNPPIPWRFRFHRPRSIAESERVEVERVIGVAERLSAADRRLWELHTALEEADFSERDRAYGSDPATHVLESLHDFRAFVQRFPDVRLETASLRYYQRHDSEPEIDMELLHPFGRRG